MNEEGIWTTDTNVDIMSNSVTIIITPIGDVTDVVIADIQVLVCSEG